MSGCDKKRRTLAWCGGDFSYSARKYTFGLVFLLSTWKNTKIHKNVVKVIKLLGQTFKLLDRENAAVKKSWMKQQLINSSDQQLTADVCTLKKLRKINFRFQFGLILIFFDLFFGKMSARVKMFARVWLCDKVSSIHSVRKMSLAFNKVYFFVSTPFLRRHESLPDPLIKSRAFAAKCVDENTFCHRLRASSAFITKFLHAGDYIKTRIFSLQHLPKIFINTIPSDISKK